MLYILLKNEAYKNLQNTPWFLCLSPRFDLKMTTSEKKSWKKYRSSFVFVSDCLISFIMYDFQKACYFLNGKCTLYFLLVDKLTLKFKYSDTRLFTVKQKKNQKSFSKLNIRRFVIHKIYVDLIQTRTKITGCCMTQPLFLVHSLVLIYFEITLPVKHIHCLIFTKD